MYHRTAAASRTPLANVYEGVVTGPTVNSTPPPAMGRRSIASRYDGFAGGEPRGLVHLSTSQVWDGLESTIMTAALRIQGLAVCVMWPANGLQAGQRQIPFGSSHAHCRTSIVFLRSIYKLRVTSQSRVSQSVAPDRLLQLSIPILKLGYEWKMFRVCVRCRPHAAYRILNCWSSGKPCAFGLHLALLRWLLGRQFGRAP